MSHIKVESGIEWNYELEGQGEETLFFIHGWGVDQRIWRQQSKYFSQDYKVLTVDLPGHGQSSWLKVNLVTMAHDLRAILESQRINRITVISSSIGGLVALKLYETFSQAIKKLIFVGSLPKFAKSWDYSHGLEIAQIRKLNHQLKLAYPTIVNIFFRSLFTREERESRRFKWLQRFRQSDEAPLREALAEYLDILENEDLRKTLQNVQTPLYFMNGTDDTICSKESVDHLKELVPNAHFHFFDKCGHFPFLSCPHEFNQVLEGFLKA